jgi:drug/metabolite transporter (DMT)-like permease
MAEAFAVASALCAALSAMLLSELRGGLPLFQLARWQTGAALLLMAAVSLIAGSWGGVVPWQFGLLALSGVMGVSVASTAYYAAIDAVGPRVTAVLLASTAPIAMVLGHVVLGEHLTVWRTVGVALTISGIVLAVVQPRGARGIVATMARPIDAAADAPALRSSRMARGIVCGLITAFGQAAGTLLARPVMATGMDPAAAITVRLGVAMIGFVVLGAFPFGRGDRASLGPRTLAICVASAVLGPALGMGLIMAALARGDVAVVATLSSITPILVLPMVWIRSGRRPSGHAWCGAAAVVAGVTVISQA